MRVRACQCVGTFGVVAGGRERRRAMAGKRKASGGERGECETVLVREGERQSTATQRPRVAAS
eukprot:4917440-Pleurochrysis_carterae.AAC.1